MTGLRQRPARARRLLLVVVSVVMTTLVLGGCGGVFGGLLTTQSDIGNDGYSSVKVNFANSETNLTVSATSSAAATAADANNIAGIVWHSFHLRFGEVTVKVHGGGATIQQTYTFVHLQQLFGPRNPAYNKTSVRQSLEHFGLIILIVIAVVVVLVIVLIVWIVRRRRKKRSLAQPGSWGPGQAYAPGGQSYGPGQGNGPGQGYAPGAQGNAPGAPGGPPAWGRPSGHGGPPAQGRPSHEGQGSPPHGNGGPGPETDPWGRPVRPPSSGWDQPGGGWDQSQGSGWGQPGDLPSDPGAPPPSSGWGEETGADR